MESATQHTRASEVTCFKVVKAEKGPIQLREDRTKVYTQTHTGKRTGKHAQIEKNTSASMPEVKNDGAATACRSN